MQRLVTATIILLCSCVANADVFNYSYTFNNGDYINGSFTGNVSGQYVTNISNISAYMTNPTQISQTNLSLNISGGLAIQGIDPATGNWSNTYYRVSPMASLNNFNIYLKQYTAPDQFYFLAGGAYGPLPSHYSQVFAEQGPSNSVNIHAFDVGRDGFPITYDASRWSLVDVTPGSSPTNPILPTCGSSCNGGALSFVNPLSGYWYDPPFARGFIYGLSSGHFTEVGVPPASFGFSSVQLVIGGIQTATLSPGDTYIFGNNVSSFELMGINPTLDAAAPGFSSAFPTLLDFSGSPSTFTMTPIIAGNLPEPETYAMVLAGLGLLGFVGRRRQKNLA